MGERLLLVTGSRALSDTPEAEAWARAEIERALHIVKPTLIVAGDARGPDYLASGLAYVRGIPFERWDLDGEVRVDGCLVRRWWPREAPRPTSSAWTLARNAAMVHSVAARAANRDTVHTLALTAPWATTRGTRHTVRAAINAGLVVSHMVQCPAKLGPSKASRG